MSYPFVQAFHDLGPARGPRLAVAWHMAEGGGTVGFLSRRNPNGVAVHFVVEYSGRIVQMLRLDHMHSSIRTSAIRMTDDWPYQWRGQAIRYGRSAALDVLGAWADISHGTLGPNHATIGVEVEGFAARGPQIAQVVSISELAAELRLPALCHRDFASYKQCPGHQFPWHVTGGHGRPIAAPEDTVNLVRLTYHRGVKVEGGRGIFSAPLADKAGLIRNTVADEILPLVGNTGTGWQVVDVGDPGGPAGYVADDAVTAFVDLDVVPTVDCSAVRAELNAANARITQALTALGGTP